MDARLGLVTGRQTAKNRGRGPDTRLLQVIVTTNEDVQTAQLIEQFGEESNPLNGSMVVLLHGGQAFKLAVAGTDGIVPKMDPGGKRIYSVNPADGTAIAEVALDPDGTLTAENGGVTMTLAPDGTTTVTNGGGSFTMSAGGQFTFTGSGATMDVPLVQMTGALQVAAGISFGTGGSADMAGTGNVVITSGDVTADGISLKTHVHDGVTSGGDTSGGPQ